MTIDSIYIISHSSDIIAYKNYFGQNRRKIAEDFSNNMSKVIRNASIGQSASDVQSEYPIMTVADMTCLYLSIADFFLLFIISSETQILMVQSLMHTLSEVLKAVFKDQLNSERLKSNFSSILFMLDHFLEKGQPLITHRQVLESLVAPQGVLDKIEEVVIGQNSHSNDNFKALEKYVDGLNDAKDNYMHRVKNEGSRMKDEILFDVVEYVDCIIDKSGNTINNEISGVIKADCQLSGFPIVSLFMTIPQPFDDFSVHEALLDQVEKFEHDKIMIFTPPSGQSSLLYYSIKTQVCRLPFNLTHHFDITNDTVKIEFKLMGSKIRGQEYSTEDFFVKVILPCDLIHSELTSTKGIISSMESSILWKAGHVPQEETLKMTAILKEKTKDSLKNATFAACLSFSIIDYSVSGTKIDKAEVKNSADKVRKGAKNITKSGYYEIRLN